MTESLNGSSVLQAVSYDPRYDNTCFLHKGKQRHRSERGNRVADQRLCSRYTGNKLPILPFSDISSLFVSSLAKQSDLCRTPLSETPKKSFIVAQLIVCMYCIVQFL